MKQARGNSRQEMPYHTGRALEGFEFRLLVVETDTRVRTPRHVVDVCPTGQAKNLFDDFIGYGKRLEDTFDIQNSR